MCVFEVNEMDGNFLIEFKLQRESRKDVRYKTLNGRFYSQPPISIRDSTK